MTLYDSRPAKASPKFWRNAALPFIEMREVPDGRRVCYAPHAHQCFSIGAVTGGISKYVNGSHAEQISGGTVVVMNPGDVHACNPIDDKRWSYRMLYVDTRWLADLHAQQDAQSATLRRFELAAIRDPFLFHALNALCEVLTNDASSDLEKCCTAWTFFSELPSRLQPIPTPRHTTHPRLDVVADFVRDHCTQPLRIEDLCAVSGLSGSYLIRAFKAQFGMTPHVYQLNARIEYCRTALRRGVAIASVAADAGFSDQAHLQRTFKRFVAATPGEYIKR
ncbi:AraC family transcriptional regulator [Caballeronia sp. BR00000012568055]|uniref:AraC family transcriptional regulator n=1 Tax=Caballeronia sp. BR00000012568055 TaxID=2918761 RepID=UPI0027D2DAEA|nr:AraC family transcriptional regulator [Caballeronia sp. BR00000012568055]